MFNSNSLLFLGISVFCGVVWCPNFGLALSVSQNRELNDNVVSASGGGGGMAGGDGAVSGCNVDRLAVYKVVLHTYWTRDLFPKHYPDWRPPAQWTKTFGMFRIIILFFDSLMDVGLVVVRECMYVAIVVLLVSPKFLENCLENNTCGRVRGESEINNTKCL